jgi:hypothetical protein
MYISDGVPGLEGERDKDLSTMINFIRILGRSS